MSSAFSPLLFKIYVFRKYTLLLFTTGSGIGTFQVDFKNYFFNSNQALFLTPGQYFKLISGNIEIIMYEFDDKIVNNEANSRFLFSHLVAIGHIVYRDSHEIFSNQVSNNEIFKYSSSILKNSTEDWLKLNPFKATLNEINLLFDLKEIIDKQYMEPILIENVAQQLNEKPYHINNLIKEKLNNTLKKWTTDKILLEAKRKVIFTDLSTKEIAYSTGFRDPDYFNRFFKNHINKSPLEFRMEYDYAEKDSFINELLNLMDTYYKEEHFAEFYANKLSVTVKTLLNKVLNKMGINFTQLISEKLLAESKTLLQQGQPINEIALSLGFKEPNHFSAFFKKKTGKTPTHFLADF